MILNIVIHGQVLPEAEDVDVVIRDQDLKVDVFRSR